MANINKEVKELEKLFSWWEFYEQTQNEEEKNKAQKQIETQKKKIRTIKDGKTPKVPKGK
jgi:hypothetical protein